MTNTGLKISRLPRQPFSDRVMYLHVGAGKTGTSALQVAFARNADRLLAAGILYPADAMSGHAKAGRVTSGNGVALAKYLGVPFGPAADGIRSDHLKEEVAHAYCAGLDLLYSSETLSVVQPEQAREFVAFANDIGYQVRAVIYFRAIADHAVSLYQQTIKHGETRLDLVEYLREVYSAGQLDTLTNLLRIFHPDDIIARNYDLAAKHLVEDFLTKVLGLDARDYDTAVEVINRSLTDVEIALMRVMNPLFKSSLQAFVASGALIYGLPDAKRSNTITSEAMRTIASLHGDSVAKINEFLPDSPITLKSERLIVSDAPGPELSEAEKALAVMVAGIIRASDLNDVMR